MNKSEETGEEFKLFSPKHDKCIHNFGKVTFRIKRINQNLLFYDFYDFNFFDFKKTVLSNLDSMTTKFCRHFCWFYFVKYYFYFLIETPGIRMAILSVYQRSTETCSVPVLTPVPVPGTGSTGYWIVLVLDCTGYLFAKRILVTPATSGPIERVF